MRNFFKLFHARTAAVMGMCGLLLTQTACAHPVVVEPAVVVQARLGGPVYGSVYAPLYGPPPVIVAPPPPPIWLAPPQPRVVVPPHAWGPPGHRHHKWREKERGHDHGWGRHGGYYYGR